MTPEIPFRRNAVEPVECIKGGWDFIKNQYWLFLGMTLVAILIGSAVPLGILLGPMMCGLYMSFFKARRGEAIEFGTLFKGFDYFGQSVVAALLHTVPIIGLSCRRICCSTSVCLSRWRLRGVVMSRTRRRLWA